MNNSKQYGMSLIEVLIALVIFSIGLLGVAGLQLVGMKTNHDSLIRTQATQLAESIAEKMLANETEVRNGNYIFSNFDTSVLGPLSVLPPLTAGVAESSYSIQGDSSTTSNQDLTEWQAMLANDLPQGVGLISCINNTLSSASSSCNKFSQGVIIISWQERGNKGTTNAGSVVFKKVVLNVLL